MNNIIPKLIQIMRSGGNVNAALQNMAGSNPVIKQYMGMVNGKSPEQLRAMAENMAKERGMSINDVLNQLGIRASNR